MMFTMDVSEQVSPSEEKEMEEQLDNTQDKDETGNNDEKIEIHESKDDKEEVKEESPCAAGEIGENKPDHPGKKKEAQGLNLNNEVVKMRKEVKRVRALIIRKLTRKIGALKKKKGKETDIERNQRRATRLLEEIHAMKTLSPDLVTKTALQKNLNFEQLCKDPKSTISDRAVARIATHPQFKKKIEDINDSVKAFKEERLMAMKQKGKGKGKNKSTPTSPDKTREGPREEEKEELTVELKGLKENEKGDDLRDGTAAKPEKKIIKETHSADIDDGQKKEMPENGRPPSKTVSVVKDNVENNLITQGEKNKPNLKSPPKVLQQKKDEEQSDVELLDEEEKEYFDDSTEERFHRQSSQSEESDDDQFFIGKVKKFKKKRKKGEAGKDEEKADPAADVQGELDVCESKQKAKATSIQSVFCSSLSGPKSGKPENTGKMKDGNKFRGQKTKGGSHPVSDFKKQPNFQKQEKGTKPHLGSQFNKPRHKNTHPEPQLKSFSTAKSQGRGDAVKQKGRFDGGHQVQKQALHPSWEASKKKKEQQGQIMAFQGKKIKFDDDY